MRKLLRWFDLVIDFLMIGCSIGFVTLAFAQVVCRFLLNSSLTWSEELCRYLFVEMVFLGAGVCILEKKTCIGGYCCKSDPKRNQKILSGISGYSRHYYRRTHRYIWIQICMWCGGTDIAGIKTSLSVRLYGNRSWRSRFDRGWHSCHVYDVDRKKHLSQLY